MLTDLVIFDIDDTLFRTTTKVKVMIGNRCVKLLSAAEYNVYSLKGSEKYDFSEIRSADHFHRTATPIPKVMNLAKKIISKETNRSRVILVTARADMDDKELFLNTFHKHGLNINKAYIHRAGNLKPLTTNLAKAKIITDEINAGSYQSIRMFDDAPANLNTFLDLRAKFPKIKFIAYLVPPDGSIKKYIR